MRQPNGMLHVSSTSISSIPSIAPGVGTTVAGRRDVPRGASGHGDAVRQRPRSSLDLVELNPFLDERGRTARLMVDLPAGLIGRKSSIVRYGRVDAKSCLRLGRLGARALRQRRQHDAAGDAIGVERIPDRARRLHRGRLPPLGAFDKTPRVASHSADGVIELMPTSDGALYGFKYVNGHPKNVRAGLQTVTAFGVLADVGDAAIRCCSTEMTILTALRTAATSAVAAKYLAPEGAQTMAIIGNGAQSEFQALAFKALLRRRCGCGSTTSTRPRRARCAANLAGIGLRRRRLRDGRGGDRGRRDHHHRAPPTSSSATILTDNMVGTGVHINAIGGDCPGKTELHRDILLRSDIFVEYAPQTRIEGEIQQLDARSSGDRALAGDRRQAPRAHGRRRSRCSTAVGFAIEDFSALRYVRDQLATRPAVSRISTCSPTPTIRAISSACF